MSDLAYRVHDAQAAQTLLLDDLTELYLRVHAGLPHAAAPIFSRKRFLERTRSQLRSPGFRLVTAVKGEVMAGFSFGFTMTEGRWWAHAEPAPPADIRDADKFAVIELIVAAEHRGEGIGRGLLDVLLDSRPERYATLASQPGSLAHSMYLRRGWVKAGEFHDEEPFMEALILALRTA